MKLFVVTGVCCFFLNIQLQSQSVKVKLDDSGKAAFNVGILVMDGVYNTELTAPYDIFQHTIFRKGIRPMNVFTVSEKGGAIRSFEGLEFESDHDFGSCPKIDILVVPAAEGHLSDDLENEAVLKWLEAVMVRATYVTSHCDGAFLLAEAGLPEGTHVTTFPGDIDALEIGYPKLKVHRDVLFVHHGKYITGVGGARSFEAALYLCDLLYGETITREIARGMVLDWPIEGLKYLKVTE